MLSLWTNPFLPERINSDSRMSTKSLFDRIFEDAWGSTLQDLYRIPVGIGIESKKNEDGSLGVSIDVPGIEESDLIVEVSDRIISIKGEKKTATSSHSIRKSFSIPEGYDAENITAELKNGVLNLKIVAQAPPQQGVKRIAVTSGK